MAVYNLWYSRVLNGRYISDVQPYNLTTSELGSLIVDSFYVEAKQVLPIDPFHFDKLKSTFQGYNTIASTTVKEHLAALAKQVV